MSLGGVLGIACWLILTSLGIFRAAGLPETWPLLAAAGLGATLGAVSRWHLLLWIGTAGAALLLVVAYTPLAPVLARNVVRTDTASVDGAQAVVVLGSSVTRDGLASAEGIERVLAGLALTHPGGPPTLVTSVVRRAPGDTVTNFRDIERIVAAAGGRRMAWLNNVFSTRDEALETLSLARRNGWTTVVVVTSTAHSRRACATFEHAGLRVICRPSAERSARMLGAETARERVAAWQYLVYEALGTVTYRWRGWL
ncbi:MAG: YdcF family protein [Gemmatimonadetes bacterium]|nr:YdcF family protein [Gemmatimonadota bacterium]